MNYTLTCLNLWEGGKLFEPIIEFLRTQHSDIVALQEAYEKPDRGAAPSLPTLSELNKQLDYRYHDFAPAMTDVFPEGKLLNGNAILSNHPIYTADVSFIAGTYGQEYDPYDVTTYPILPRNLQHVAIETVDGIINVFNFQGVWDLDGDNDSPARRKMVAHIMEATRGLDRVIIAGDSNARPTNPALRPLEDGFVNVFDQELTTTFNMRRKSDPGYGSSAVDIIYVSDDIHVLEHTCHDVDISDHLPLSITFEIRWK